MSKLVGTLKEGDRPFTGQIIITALNGSVESYGVKSGKPKSRAAIHSISGESLTPKK